MTSKKHIQTIGSIIRRAVGEYEYRSRETKNFVSGMEVIWAGGKVEARFVNFSGVGDEMIDNKETLISTSQSALIASGYATERIGNRVIVIA